MEAHIARLQERLAERDAELAERDAELAERDAELAERDAELAERDAELAERDAELAERDAELAERAAELAEQLAATRADREAERDVNRQLVAAMAANQQLIADLADARATARANADRIHRDEERFERSERRLDSLVNAVEDLRGEIRTGVSLATARLRVFRRERGTRMPSLNLEHRYLLSSSHLPDGSADPDSVTIKVSQGQSTYLQRRRETLERNGETILRCLPSGNGVDLRQNVRMVGNAQLERMLTPEERRLYAGYNNPQRPIFFATKWFWSAGTSVSFQDFTTIWKRAIADFKALEDDNNPVRTTSMALERMRRRLRAEIFEHNRRR